MADTQTASTQGTSEGNTHNSSEPGRILDPAARMEQASAIIRKNVLWSLGAGVVPFPLVDVMAVMAVHVKMLREFSLLYGVKFTEGAAKKLVGTLLSGIGVVGIGSAIGGSLAKFVPVIGSTLSLISVPVLAGAATHALGRVLIMHFEAGGTLLDFEPQAMREYFKQEFDKAKEVVSQLHRETQHAKGGAKPA